MSNVYLPAAGDTFVYQFHPDRNYGQSEHMSGGRDTNGSLGYMLLSFAVRSALPPGSSIGYAALVLSVTNSFQPAAPVAYDVLRVKSNWSARSVTWDTLPLCEPTPQASFASPAIGVLNVDVTPLAQDWLSGLYAERGVLIRARGYPSPGTYFQAATVNARDTDNWPRLSIDHTLPFVTIAPTFTNHHTNLTVPAGGEATYTRDVSLAGIMTVAVSNNGPDAIAVHLEVSADGLRYVPSSSLRSIPSGGVSELAADLFARYLRVILQDSASNGASADIYFQGQIG